MEAPEAIFVEISAGEKNNLPGLPSLKRFHFRHPENGWLEYDRFLLGRLGLFSGANCEFQGWYFFRFFVRTLSEKPKKQVHEYWIYS